MQEDSLMNRALLKQDAKDAMKAANPHPQRSATLTACRR